MRLWAEAWEAGTESARHATGTAHGQPGRPVAALSGLAATWTAQIMTTTLKLIAAALAAGGTAISLSAAISAVLMNAERASQIAQTEITRLMSLAAEKVYEAAGLIRIRWVVEDDNACPACLGNQAAGPWPLGVPFPSGALLPPDHVRCRCATVPA
jgi:hypothetical protein